MSISDVEKIANPIWQNIAHKFALLSFCTKKKTEEVLAHQETHVGKTHFRKLRIGEPCVGKTRIGETRVGKTRVGETRVGEPCVGKTCIGEPCVGETCIGA